MATETERLEAMLALALRLRKLKGDGDRKPLIAAYVDAAMARVNAARVREAKRMELVMEVVA